MQHCITCEQQVNQTIDKNATLHNFEDKVNRTINKTATLQEFEDRQSKYRQNVQHCKI
jgi:hypothetical protein